MSLINTKPTGFSGGVSQINTNLSPNTTTNVDTNSSSSVASIKYIITLVNGSNGHTKVIELLALPRATDIKYTMYGILGDDIDYSIDVVLNGGNIELQITNSESVPITASVFRILTNN